MAQPRASTSYALIAGIVLVSGAGTWVALMLHGRAAAPGSQTAPGGTAVRAPVAMPAPVSTQAAPRGEGAAGTSHATLDQRQDEKITRGMTVNPGGGILVSAVPPYSVVSQLRVEEGDVIVSVNGQPVGSPEEFARIYREQGLPRQMTVIHRGREMHHH